MAGNKIPGQKTVLQDEIWEINPIGDQEKSPNDDDATKSGQNESGRGLKRESSTMD